MSKTVMGYEVRNSGEGGHGAWRPRRWRGHWLRCWGECSPEDAVGCCFGYSNPCGIAYSWNVSKVLHLSFWRELCKYIALILLVHWIFSGVYWSKLFSCSIKSFMARLEAAAGGSTVADPEETRKIAVACAVAASFENAAFQQLRMLVVLVCVLCWAIFVGGKRRRQMREELGIPVTAEGRCCSLCHNRSEYCNDDCCLHFWCIPCAVAQETRTILHEEAVGSMPARLVGAGYRSDLAGEALLLAPHELDDMQRAATTLPV